MSKIATKNKIAVLGFFLLISISVGTVFASSSPVDPEVLFGGKSKSTLRSSIKNFFDDVTSGLAVIFYTPEILNLPQTTSPSKVAEVISPARALAQSGIVLTTNSQPKTKPQINNQVKTQTITKTIVQEVSDTTLISRIRNILNTSEFQSLLKNNNAMTTSQLTKNTTPVSTPAPIPSVFMPVGISQPAPAFNFSGATFFSATDLSSKYFKTGEATVGALTVSGSSTIGGDLNVTGNITGTILGTINPSFALGSIPFQGATGLSEDNVNLFWDNTTKRFGLGTNNPTATLDVRGDMNLDGSLVLPALSSGATPTSKYFKLATGESVMILRDDPTYYTTGLINGLDIFLGRNAGNLTATGGGNNIALGDAALNGLTSGYGNIAIGMKSSLVTTSGNYNIAIGLSSLANNTASGLVGVGYQTLGANTTGGFNTALGNSALAGNTTGSYNTAVGADAQRNTTTSPTGSFNVSVGGATLRYMTSGGQNTAIGYHTGHSTSSGSNNTYLGYLAGENNTIGSRNIFLGSYAGWYNSAVSDQIFINSIDRGSYAGDQTGSPIYIQQNATVSSQVVTLNGNVGIGTISPYSRLTNYTSNVMDSSGFGLLTTLDSFSWSSSGAGYVAAIENRDSNTTVRNGLLVKTAATDTGSYIARFESGGSNRLSIRADGNVGIGTASPGAGLQNTKNGVASTPGELLSGTWFSGGTSTTTKPQLLIEPTGAVSTAWNTNGTGLGVNSATGFTGNLIDAQLNGSSILSINYAGQLNVGNSSTGGTIGTASTGTHIFMGTSNRTWLNQSQIILNNATSGTIGGGRLQVSGLTQLRGLTADSSANALTVENSTPTNLFTIRNDGNVGIGTMTPGYKLSISNTGGSAVAVPYTWSDDTSARALVQLMDASASPRRPEFYIAGTNIPSSDSVALISASNANSGMSFVTRQSASPFSLFTRMVIQGDGNVGIGTSSPQQALHVSTATNYQGIFINGNAAPSVGFRTSNNTTPTWKVGISGNNSNNFAISAGASNDDKLVVDSSGNVGIGTTSPVSKLHVGLSPTASTNFGLLSIGGGNFDGASTGYFIGSSSGTHIAVQENSTYTGDFFNFGRYGASSGTRVKLTGTGVLSFETVNTTGLTTALGYIQFNNRLQIYGNNGIGFGAGGVRILATGTDPGNIAAGNLIVDNNLGIGVTSPFSGASVTSSLELGNFNGTNADGNLIVRGYAALGGISKSGYGAVGSNYYLSSANALLAKNTNSVSLIEFSAGGFIFKNAGSTTANSAITLTERMRLDSSGNLGIGTNNPTHPLEVSGGTGYFSSGVNVLSVTPLNSGVSLFVGNGAATSLTFDKSVASGGSGNAYFSGGNIGIGATSPGSLLQIIGTSNNGGSLRIGTVVETSAAAATISAINSTNQALVLYGAPSQSQPIFNIKDSTATSSFFSVSPTGGAMSGAWSIGGGGSFTISTGSTGNDLIRLSNVAGSGRNYYLGSQSNGTFVIRDATAGADRITMDSSGNLGIGTSTVSAKLHALATTEQLRLGYDASNYFSTTVGSTGSTTFALTGTSPTFTFNQSITTQAGMTFNNANNNNAYIFTNGDSYGISFQANGNNFYGTGVNGSVIKFGNVFASIGVNKAVTAGGIPADSFILSSGANSNISLVDYSQNEIVSARTVSGLSYLVLNGGFNSGTNVSVGSTRQFYLNGPVGTGTGTPGDIVFSTGNVGVSGTTPHVQAERLRIQGGTGNVGIGTGSTINYKLEVLGTFRASGNSLIGTNTSSGTSTPINLSLGGTYGTNTAGAVGNLKLDLYNDGTANRSGFGISANKLEYQTPSGTVHAMYVGGNLIQSIDDNAVLIKSGLFSTSTYAQRIGNLLTQNYQSNNTTIVDNAYFNGSSWTRLATGFASGIQMYNGHLLMVAGATGTGTFTPTYPFKANSAGTVGIGGDGGNVANTFTGNTLVATSSAVGILQPSPGFALHIGSSSVVDGTTLLRLQDSNSTCDFNANTGAPTCGSDLTLKKDISSLDTASLLTKISALNPVSYHWLTEDSGAPLQNGFIAQEVEAQFPDLVSEHTWIDGSTKKFLNMSGLMPYVVGAVKEMDIRVQGLSSLDTTNTNSLGSLVKQFLADVTNGLDDIFVKKVHTQQICLKDEAGETCITRSELNTLLQNQNSGAGSSNNTPPKNNEVDLCPNIEGSQASVPDGMHIDENNNCVDNVLPPNENTPTE